MRICIPIVADSVDSALVKMDRAFNAGDLLELRVDRIGDANLQRLLKREPARILVTNRRTEEGGAFAGTERERVALLLEAVRLGAGYVDIEAATDTRLIKKMKDTIGKNGGRTRLIVSNHDITGTPGHEILKRRLAEGTSLGAAIVKIVTTARTMEDNLNVLGLIPYARKAGMPVIAFCMGEAGRMSRVMAGLLGSFLTFASLNRGEESAPGQITIKEMREILERVQGAKGSRVRVKQSEKDI